MVTLPSQSVNHTITSVILMERAPDWIHRGGLGQVTLEATRGRGGMRLLCFTFGEFLSCETSIHGGGRAQACGISPVIVTHTVLGGRKLNQNTYKFCNMFDSVILVLVRTSMDPLAAGWRAGPSTDCKECEGKEHTSQAVLATVIYGSRTSLLGVIEADRNLLGKP